jgi:hypothetical protein
MGKSASERLGSRSPTDIGGFGRTKRLPIGCHRGVPSWERTRNGGKKSLPSTACMRRSPSVRAKDFGTSRWYARSDETHRRVKVSLASRILQAPAFRSLVHFRPIMYPTAPDIKPTTTAAPTANKPCLVVFMVKWQNLTKGGLMDCDFKVQHGEQPRSFRSRNPTPTQSF